MGESDQFDVLTVGGCERMAQVFEEEDGTRRGGARGQGEGGVDIRLHWETIENQRTIVICCIIQAYQVSLKEAVTWQQLSKRFLGAMLL